MTHFFYKTLPLSFIVAFCVIHHIEAQSINNPWEQFIGKQEKVNTKSASEYYLIRIPTKTSSSQLKAVGIHIIRKLDHDFAIASFRQKSTSRQILSDIWVANNTWKLGPGLKTGSGKTSLHIRSLDISHTEKRLQSLGLEFKKHRDKGFLISANKETIENHLMDASEIIYIGIESRSPTADFRVTDLNINPNKINLIHNQYPALDGEGITVSIQERKYDTEDNDIIGRNVPSPLSAEEQTNHATSMATIVAGAGNSFVNGRGVAKAALLTSSDFDNELGALPDEDEEYTDLDVTIQNHSYGDSIENFYGMKAEAFDLSANANSTLLHVMSSGNTGHLQDEFFSYKGVSGFANLSGNYKMAKNILLVGSVDTVGRPVNRSSKGPTYDGRVKPEIVTYSVSGTSNSSALVAGTSALLQQYYLEENGSHPESALLKALMINSAEDVHNPAVDYYTGFGNLNAHRALENLMNGNYLSESIGNGETRQFDITVPMNAENLKVTVVWNDPAALPNSNIALINDLDMEVSNGGDIWLPWVLSSAKDSAALAQNAQRGKDHLNNVEQITVEEPINGNHTITITGTDIPSGPQQFYIAYQWDVKDRFDWTFPTSTDNMPYDGETGSYFRWESTLSQNIGVLEYSIDNGASWETIDSNVDLSQGSYRWMPPEINTSAIARIVVNGTNYTTEQFSISRPLRITVGFNCADSTLIQWNKSPLAKNYDVFTLGGKYLEKIATTADTSFIINKNTFEKRFFTIQPVLEDGHKLIKSYTVDYDLQGIGCYLVSFFPEITENQELFLNLELGTIYGVDEVVIERKVDENFETVASLTPDNRVIRVQETTPQQGPNIHRATIRFLNGETITTEETLIYYLTETAFLVFPNPIVTGDELRIFSKAFETGTEVTFTLYNRTGQMVRKKQIISDREFIDMEGLQPGLYIYKVNGAGEEAIGKVVVAE